MMRRKFLCLIHVERAGGTTMHNMFQENMPTYVTLKSWRGENVLSKEKVRWLLRTLPYTPGIGGHTTRSYLGYEELIGDKEMFYLTFLREPVARYMSHFNYQRIVKGIDRSMEAFLDESKFTNFQTKKICGKPDVGMAKGILKSKFGFVGLTERFDESLVLLRRILIEEGLLNIHYERRNELKEGKDLVEYRNLPASIKRRIQGNNALDAELYEFVQQDLYPRFVQQYGSSLEEEVREFQKSNVNFQYMKSRRALAKCYKGFIRYLIEPMMHRVS